MPELRKDPTTARWVIVSTDRRPRASDFERETVKKLGMLKAHRHTPDR